MYELIHYTTPQGKDPVADWMDKMRDYKAATRILARFEKLRDGHFGDCKSLQNGVWELRIDVGQGYRVYYSRIGKEILLLLCGGDKGSQNRDISKALEFLNDYKRRNT